MLRRHVIAGLFAAPVLAGSVPAFAHREKLTSTNIKWNIFNQTLEINHIFHIHHAEQALNELGIIAKPDLRSLSNQARLALYVEEQFSLENADGDTLALSMIGAEANGTNMHVYQEASLSNPPNRLLVTCGFLRPVVPSQINEIHLDIDGKIASMRLSGRQTQKLLIAK